VASSTQIPLCSASTSDFLAQNKHLPSLVLGRHPSFQNCPDPIWLRIADPTWLRIETAWGDVNLLDNIRHLQIDVGSLSASVSQKEIRDPSLLLFSLFWNHFAKPRMLHRLDIKLDVSQLHYKLDWRSIILADIWVWLELCRWQVLKLCTCDPPRAPKSLAIRYRDTGRMEDQNAWHRLAPNGLQAVTTFREECLERQTQRDQRFSLETMIEERYLL
jgi:hypothetical protein